MANETTVKTALIPKEKIAKSIEMKNEGNEKFKAMDYQGAIRKYHNALLYVKGLGDRSQTLQALGGGTEDHPANPEITEEDKKKIKDLQFMCYNNLAACLLKKEKYDRALDYANKAVDIEPKNTKALFRRGTSHFNLRNFHAAESDFKEVIEINPKETAVGKYLKAIDTEKKKGLKKQQEMYSKMF